MMEIAEDPCTLRHGSPEESVPSLLQYISANEMADFDTINGFEGFTNQNQPSKSSMGSKESAARPQSVSISMPPTPTGYHFHGSKTSLFTDQNPAVEQNPESTCCATNQTPGSCDARFYSQPMPKGAMYMHSPQVQPNSARDTRFDSFKTWSGKLERQLTILRGRPVEPEPDTRKSHHMDTDALPVNRYFDALEGPELDTLRPLEEAVLPDDGKWPFLLRFTVASFGICLGLSSQAILWKTLATSLSTNFLHITLKLSLILWLISITLTLTVSLIYLLKLFFYFEAVRREYYHPIRVNFFFAPWIAFLFLCIGAPQSIATSLPQGLWYFLMAPIFCLELKIYGQWMSGGQRRLSKVANPSNHLSVVGNFVGALLGASMGLKEGPLFFFAVGLAHYTVLFVTLYQRLPTNETLPKELHPVFFLFVAAPSVASMAWAKIQGSFDDGARIAYFIAIFSLAWWAYTFPMTGAAIATIRYSNEVTNLFTRSLAVALCTVSALTVTALLVTTVIHAFVLRDLFPNDIAIAISDRPPMQRKKWFPNLGNNGSSDMSSDVENYLKFVTSHGKSGKEEKPKNVDDSV
ncbi:hypothetical protein V2J09_004731 [Rumex salicifolius]